MLAQDKDKDNFDPRDSVVIITFGEFMERWYGTGSMLIGPQDYETRDKNQLGIVSDRMFKRIYYSDPAKEVKDSVVKPK